MIKEAEMSGQAVCGVCGAVMTFPEQQTPPSGVTAVYICDKCSKIKEEDEKTFSG